MCGLILLFAETYAWIVLVLWLFPCRMASESSAGAIAKDMSLWPSVDIFVPDLQRRSQRGENTIYASLGIDWPKDKLNIWISMTAWQGRVSPVCAKRG
ncbi:hypothetical protein DMI65_13055 [Escherichia coli]|nr:hypothetical protein [Escherichia coli]